jgi:hypothetical protein
VFDILLKQFRNNSGRKLTILSRDFELYIGKKCFKKYKCIHDALFSRYSTLQTIHNTTSHKRMDLSLEPDTIVLPLGEKDTEFTNLE